MGFLRKKSGRESAALILAAIYFISVMCLGHVAGVMGWDGFWVLMPAIVVGFIGSALVSSWVSRGEP